MSLLQRADRIGKELALATLHLLYPPVCAVCSQELNRSVSNPSFICGTCANLLERLDEPWCLQCGDPIDSADIDLCERCAHEYVSFDHCQSYGLYEGPLARAIQVFKYEGERALVHQLASLLVILVHSDELDRYRSVEAITFVPMRPAQKQARGYNQSELLARALGRLIEVPVMATLKKTRNTTPQMKLSGNARRTNLQGAFVARDQQLPERALIVDDVYTTGSTLSECATALKAAGVEYVAALTLARAPLSDHTEEYHED